MTHESIRIYTESGFVFELSYDWVLTHMGEHQFLYNSDKSTLKNKLDVIEYVKNLSWPELMPQLKFVGIIEDSSQDTLKGSVLDLVNNPLNYKPTQQKNMQFKLSKL
jgi:hypothetical protein